jgi:hypothetical protein
MASAAARTLAVPELLTNILLQLDEPTAGTSHFSAAIEDLFVFQRVSKDFQAVINDSVHLRRIMLLEHEAPDAAERPYGMRYLLDHDTVALKYHPLLPCVRKEEEQLRIRGSKQRLETHVVLGVYWRPHLPLEEDQLLNSLRCSHGSGSWDLRPYLSYTTGELNAKTPTSRKQHLSSIDASWRRMKLLSHPKPLTIYIGIDLTFARVEGGMSTMIGFEADEEVLVDLYNKLKAVLVRDRNEFKALQDDQYRLLAVIDEGATDLHFKPKATQAARECMAMARAHRQPDGCCFGSADCQLCAVREWMTREDDEQWEWGWIDSVGDSETAGGEVGDEGTGNEETSDEKSGDEESGDEETDD